MARVARPRGLKTQMQATMGAPPGSTGTDNKTTECAYYDELELSGTVGMFTTRQNSAATSQLTNKTPSFLPDLSRVTNKTETPLRTTKLEEHLRKRLDERDKQISVLTAENEELTAHCATNRAIMDGLQKELEELTAQLKEKTRQLVEKTGQLETEQVITADLLSKLTVLQEAHDTLQIENSILRKRLKDLGTSSIKPDEDISTEVGTHGFDGPRNARSIHTMQSIARRLSLDKEETTPHSSPSQISSDRLSDKASSHSSGSPGECIESYIAISQGASEAILPNSMTGLHASVSKPSNFIEGDIDEGQQKRQRGASTHNYTTYLDNVGDLDDLELDDQEDTVNMTASYADELRPTREVVDNLKDTASPGLPREDASYSEVYCSRSKSRNTSLICDAQDSLFNGSLSPHAISHAAELELIVQGNESDDCVQASHLSASLMKSHSFANNNSNVVNNDDIYTNAEEIRIDKPDGQASQEENSINSSGLDSTILGALKQATDNATANNKVEAECIQSDIRNSTVDPVTAEGDDTDAGLVTKEAGAGVALEIIFDDTPNRQMSAVRNQKLLEAQNQRVQQFKERRAQMRQRELEEAAEQSDLVHSRSSSSMLGSPGSNKRNVHLNRRSARPRKQSLAGDTHQEVHVNSSMTNPDKVSGYSGSYAERRGSFSAHANPSAASHLESDTSIKGSGVEGTELVYKVSNRPAAKSAAQQEPHFIEYLPPAKFDNSSFVQKLILHNLLPGTANYERRMLAMDNVSRERGHLLLVFRDTERKSYHSCVKVDELSGSLIKVDGPDNMPNELAQTIIESMLKYDSSSRSFLVVDQRQLSTLVVAITLKVRRKKVSGR